MFTEENERLKSDESAQHNPTETGVNVKSQVETLEKIKKFYIAFIYRR